LRTAGFEPARPKAKDFHATSAFTAAQMGVRGLDCPFTVARRRAVGASRPVSTPSPGGIGGLARDCRRHGPDEFPDFGRFCPRRFRRGTQVFKSSVSTVPPRAPNIFPKDTKMLPRRNRLDLPRFRGGLSIEGLCRLLQRHFRLPGLCRGFRHPQPRSRGRGATTWAWKASPRSWCRQLPEKAIHGAVGQQGADHAALRRAAGASLAAAHASAPVRVRCLGRRLEPKLDQSQDMAVDDPCRNRRKRVVVRDRIKKCFDRSASATSVNPWPGLSVAYGLDKHPWPMQKVSPLVGRLG